MSPSGPHNALFVQDLNAETDSLRSEWAVRNTSPYHSHERAVKSTGNELSILEVKTFRFSTPNHLLTTFKGIGQLPSRCITSIHLRLGPMQGNVLEIFEKSLNLLVKRALKSSFQRLDLGLGLSNILGLIAFRYSGKTNVQFFFHDFLSLINKGFQIMCGKRITVVAVWKETLKQYNPKMLEGLIRGQIERIYFACREFYWG